MISVGEKGKIMEYGLLTLRLRFRLIVALLVCSLAGCGSGESVLPDAVPGTEPDLGEPVTLAFNLYSAALTRADGAGTTSTTEEDLRKAEPLLAVPCILEEFVPFDFEASIVMVSDGERVVSFPIGRNVHRDGILDLCFVPAEVDGAVLARMKSESERFMRDCDYRGILAIEYFVRQGEIYFNEMAPRPHNSGHYTIEGATTNQFRELVRYLVGMPLEEPRLVAPTVMKNILGQDLEEARKVAAEHRPGVYVHLYGKSESRPKRKMGHITFVGMQAGEYERDWAARFV